jgi:hypothetical protein
MPAFGVSSYLSATVEVVVLRMFPIVLAQVSRWRAGLLHDHDRDLGCFIDPGMVGGETADETKETEGLCGRSRWRTARSIQQ